jgi:hypothetical protein
MDPFPAVAGKTKLLEETYKIVPTVNDSTKKQGPQGP